MLLAQQSVLYFILEKFHNSLMDKLIVIYIIQTSTRTHFKYK